MTQDNHPDGGGRRDRPSSSDLAGSAAAVSGAACIGAGIYLLNLDVPALDQTWFEAIAQGLGIYMIGKGVFVGTVLWLWQRKLAEEEAGDAKARPQPEGQGRATN